MNEEQTNREVHNEVLKTIINLQAELDRLKALQIEERKSYGMPVQATVQASPEARADWISSEVQALVKDRRLTAENAPAAIARAIADPTYLDELRAMPRAPEPLPTLSTLMLPLSCSDDEQGRRRPTTGTLTHYPLAGGQW